jgi:acetolactate synthase-1/3 small subunit
MFTRRGYNIESIAAGVTENPDITRITIVATGDEVVLEQVSKQLRKLIDVIKVQDLKYSESLVRELVLLTIFVPREKRQEVITTAGAFQAIVVDITERTMTLEFVGNARKVNLITQALSAFKVKELARTGYVALPLESQVEREHVLI